MIWTARSGAGKSADRPARRRRGLVVAAIGTAAALLLAGCTGASGSGTGSSSSKTLTIALPGDPGTLDWTSLGSGGTTLLLLQTGWDTLLRQKPDGTVEPNAAESYKMSADFKTLTLQLRSGMKFADGSPIDSAAVKTSLEHLRDAKTNESVFLAGAKVSTSGDLGVTITLPNPQKLLPDYLAVAAGIIANPKSIKDKALLADSSGPYTIVKSKTTTGATYTFDRNKNYWNSKIYPYDHIVYRVFTDPTASLSALKTGQINATYVPTQSVAEVKGGNFNLTPVSINWAGLHIFDRQGKLVPALKDVRVRQAMNMVFDRTAIVKALFQGKGTVSNQIFNPTSKNPGYDPALADTYPYDVAKAKALMKEAGYADGFSLKLPKVPGFDAANPLIIQQLGQLNIKVDEVAVPLTQFNDILQGKYPIFYFTLGSTNSAARVVDDALRPTSIWNPMHVQSPELNTLLARADSASGADATAAYQAIDKYVVDQAWFAPWAYITENWAETSDTKAETCVGNLAPYLYTFKPAN